MTFAEAIEALDQGEQVIRPDDTRRHWFRHLRKTSCQARYESRQVLLAGHGRIVDASAWHPTLFGYRDVHSVWMLWPFPRATKRDRSLLRPTVAELMQLLTHHSGDDLEALLGTLLTVWPDMVEDPPPRGESPSSS